MPRKEELQLSDAKQICLAMGLLYSLFPRLYSSPFPLLLLIWRQVSVIQHRMEDIHRLDMDPEHCEYLAEDVLIQIVPRRNEPVLHLVCGDVGPLEAGIPTEVPLWLAADLRRRHHCEIVPPFWFNLDELKRLVAVEGETEGLSHLPPFIFEISNLMVRVAKEDIVDGDQIKVLLQDLWDKREAKLRTSSLKLLSQHAHAHVRLDDVQPLEVAMIRPNLSACKQIARLMRNVHNIQPI